MTLLALKKQASDVDARRHKLAIACSKLGHEGVDGSWCVRCGALNIKTVARDLCRALHEAGLTQVALADRLGVRRGVVNHWCCGREAVPPKHCAAIEAATGGKVTRRDLRPDDWWLIWPELIDAKHPAPEAKAA